MSADQSWTCPECRAVYATADDGCATRFETLLALDHTRREPWGSRHGQAFAAYALQHPTRLHASLDHAWAALHRIYVDGERPSRVFSLLATRRDAVTRDWGTPPRPTQPVAPPAVTIADLGDFAAAHYPERLDA